MATRTDEFAVLFNEALAQQLAAVPKQDDNGVSLGLVIALVLLAAAVVGLGVWWLLSPRPVARERRPAEMPSNVDDLMNMML